MINLLPLLTNKNTKGVKLLVLTTPNEEIIKILKEERKKIEKANTLVLSFFKLSENESKYANFVSLPVELDPTSFLILIENFVLKVKPSLLILDSLKGLTIYLNEEEKLRFIRSLKNLAIENNVKLIIANGSGKEIEV
jgi:hypothetical protein